MAYRYKKTQIFAKTLDVPKDVRELVYSNSVNLYTYVEYELNGKIPTSCLYERDRKVLEKFGFERIRTLDFELLNHPYRFYSIDVYEELLKLDSIPDNLNYFIYDLVGDVVQLDDYTPGMREYFKTRFFSDEEITEENSDSISAYITGKATLVDIFDNWDVFKYKDIGYILRKDKYNERYNITIEDVHNFVNEYGSLLNLVMKRVNVYEFINDVIKSGKSEEEKHAYIKDFIEGVIAYAKKHGKTLSNEEYREIFKYIDMKDYLEEVSIYTGESIVSELETLGPDYLYNQHIPVSVLFKRDVLRSISYFGIKNIIDFDLECGGLFSKNDYYFLKKMYDMYIHYANNEHDPKKTIDLRTYYDEDGNYIGRQPFTKYQFFESMRRMLKYGPSASEFFHDSPNFSAVTGEFREVYPELFLSDDAPKELQEMFYTRELDCKVIHDHPEFAEFLRGKDLEAGFKKKFIKYEYTYFNLFEYLSRTYGHDEMINFISEYYELIETVYQAGIMNEGYQFNYDDDFKNLKSMDDIKKFFNKLIIIAIEKRDTVIPRDVPDSMKVMYPNLFLSDDTPEDIKNAYYNREFTYDFVVNYPDIMEYFKTTDIAYGFNKDFKWLLGIKTTGGIRQANEDKLRVLEYYGKIQDKDLQDNFIQFVKENADIALTNLEVTSKLLQRLSFSNSLEVFNFRSQLAKQLLAVDNPLESLDKVEKIFIKNDLPTYAKLFGVFNILHPGCYGFNFGIESRVSPVLKNASVSERERVIQADLLKSAMLSNNRTLNSFIDVIEIGEVLIESDILSEEDVYLATKFRDCLVSILELNGKSFKVSEDVLGDIRNLKSMLAKDGEVEFDIADRVIEIISGPLGFTTMNEFKTYIKDTLDRRDKEARERAYSYGGLTITDGDLVKGIGDIKYLKNILQNGSVSKEYLGASASSDGTPLDTDLSMITVDLYGNEENIKAAGASSYGSIYFVLKNKEGRFNVTRGHNGEETSLSDDRLELFYTGVIDSSNSKHYGIRTGFASSEIDFIVLGHYNPAVFLEIAMNGIYIPVVDMDNKLIFSPNDYDNLRRKMSGLSYYETGDYQFSDSLVTPDVESIAAGVEKNEMDIKYKRDKVLSVIKSVLDEEGLLLKTGIDGDLTEGSVELIDTGSTGRGTNKFGDGDFDFMMRVDRVLLQDSKRLSSLKSKLLSKFGSDSSHVIGTGDFRLKDVVLDDIIVDIDITFTEKTDKISYSTDMALVDRLSNIKKVSPEKYPYVIANILLAKQVLKEAGCYKPNRGETPQGGLGGVGIENWVLQNGGSFMDACESFLRIAQGKNFEEFKECYQVFDFGENHLAQRRGQYVHDNFVFNNMSEAGYEKMRDALNEYVYKVRFEDKKTSSLN